MALRTSQGFAGGPLPRSTVGHPSALDRTTNRASPFAGVGWSQGIRQGHEIAQDMFVDKATPANLGRDGSMAKDTSIIVPEDVNQRVVRLQPQFIVMTQDMESGSNSLERLMSEVFSVMPLDAPPQEVQGVVTEFVKIKIPQLQRTTVFSNSGKVINVEIERSTVRAELFSHTHEYAQDFAITELGEDIINGIAKGLVRQVAEALLIIIMGLLVEFQIIPMGFNQDSATVTYTQAYGEVLGKVGCVNDDPVSLFPTLAQQSTTASQMSESLPCNAVIMHKQTRDACQSYSGDRVFAESGGSDGNWDFESTQARKKAPSSGLSFYTYPLRGTPNTNEPGLRQTVLTFHVAWLRGKNLADPIKSIRRIWTATDVADEISLSTLAEGLRRFFDPNTGEFQDPVDAQGYDEQCIADEGIDMRAVRNDSLFYTDLGAKIKCLGDIKEEHFTNQQFNECVSGLVVNRLRKWVSRSNASGNPSVFLSGLRQVAAGAMTGNLPGKPEDLYDPAAVVLPAYIAQCRLVARTPVGFASYSGLKILASILDVPGVRNGIYSDSEVAQLNEDLDAFGSFCERIKELFDNSLVGDMDPVGSSDVRDLIFLNTCAINHTPLHYTRTGNVSAAANNWDLLMTGLTTESNSIIDNMQASVLALAVPLQNLTAGLAAGVATLRLVFPAGFIGAARLALAPARGYPSAHALSRQDYDHD
jgi:hypothetical protein